MSSVCNSDQHHHKFHPSQQLLSPKKSLIREIDIPPRKLLTRRSAQSSALDRGAGMFSDDSLFHKFLPYNNPSADSDSGSDTDDPYSSDHFRMYEFKVRRCTRSRSHDWTDCPFAHPGEKARRRDPRRFHYSGTVCPEYRRGSCSRGDNCDFAHGVFECWLHPARYRTEACKDGKNCKRKVCFFAHTPKQLRILPVTMNSSNDTSPCKTNKLNCCLFCHHFGDGAANSPTSTLLCMSRCSPPLSPSSSAASPPLSPVNRVSPVSLYSACRGSGVSNSTSNNVTYNDVVNELMSSLEGLSFSDSFGVSAAKTTGLPWVDVSNLNCEDQQEFVFSPSNNTMMMVTPRSYDDDGKYSRFFSNDYEGVANAADDVNGSNCPAPDLRWVNELLM